MMFLDPAKPLATAGFFTTLVRSFCTQCINFACPLNRVGEETRNAFFDRNPAVAEAWKKE